MARLHAAGTLPALHVHVSVLVLVAEAWWFETFALPLTTCLRWLAVRVPATALTIVRVE